MPNPTSMLAYPEVKEALDRALASERGVKVSFKSEGQAHRFVGRCCTYRILDRKENLKIYQEPAHMYHGRSVYDVLVIARRGTEVTIKPTRADSIEMEEL